MALRGWAAPEIWSSLYPALALAESLGRNDALLPIPSGLCTNLHNQGRVAEALQWMEKMLDAADATGDVRPRISAHANAVVSYFWLGKLTMAREHGDKLLTFAFEAERDRTALDGITSTYAAGMTSTGCCASQWTWMFGYPDQAVRICEEKDRNARGIGESIRPRSRNGLRTSRNPVVELAPNRTICLMLISLRCAPRRGAIGAG